MTASLLVAACVAFAATTVDDLIIVTALFTAGRVTGRPRPVTIIVGQYAGFIAILGICLAAATGLQAVPDRWVGLFGFVPIGADNIGVFTPLFRSMGLPCALTTSIGFLVLVGVWCALGALLGTHRAVVATLGRIDHWLVPVVFVVIGVLILVTTGAVGLLSDIVTT